MKGLTIWQRLNLTNLLLIVLLSAGALIAWWVKQVKSNATEFEQQSTAVMANLRVSFIQLSDGLRGQLLDPTSATERDRVSEAEASLATQLDKAEELAVDDSDSLRVLRSLRDFTKELLNHKATVVEMTRSDPPAALTYYAQTYASLLKRQYDLLEELQVRLSDLAVSRIQEAKGRAAFGFASLGVILVLSVLISLALSSSINKPIIQLTEHLDGLRSGDFSRRLKVERGDEFGTIAEGVNSIADDLSNVVGQAQRSGIKINTTATDIAASAKQQQSTANEIAATTAEIGATSKQISTTSQELVETISEVSEVAEDTAELAGTGQGAITRMEETMHHIMNASKAITSKLSILAEKTGNISSVVTTINKVADQTNLLSLNAAIEAEKAGEYGLGFAVVAIEIRRLADQTAVATYDIERMVKEMQSAVTAGVLGMDRFSEDVRRGVEQIREVGLHLAQIINQVQALNPRFQTVHEGMQSQASGAQQICETLAQLNETAHQTADSLRQSNYVIESLYEAARGLQSSITKFKFDRSPPL